MPLGYSVYRASLGVEVTDPDLIAGWNMSQRVSGQIEDVSGNGNTGIVNGAPFQTRCLLGSFFEFNGVDQNVDVTGITTTSTDYTFAFWVKSDSSGFQEYLFYSQGTSGNLAIAWSRPSGNLGIFDGTWKEFGPTPSDGQWHPVVFVFDTVGLSVDCYVDGIASGITQVYNPTVLGGSISLYSNAAGTAEFFEGSVLNASICDCVKTQSWAVKQYNRSRFALWKTRAVPTTGTVSDGFIGDSSFQVESGLIKVSSVSIDNDNLSFLETPSGACNFYTSASLTQQTPEENAYGYWCMHTQGSVSLYWAPIASANGFISDVDFDGYSLTISGAGGITFRRSDNGALVTIGTAPAGALTPGEFSCVEMLRYRTGRFVIFANGNSVIDTTDNTYTESAYQTYRIAAPDRFVALGSLAGQRSMIKRLLA